MERGSIASVLSLLIVAALWLVACGNDGTKITADSPSLATHKPVLTLPSTTIRSQVEPDSTGQSASLRTAETAANSAAASAGTTPTPPEPINPPPTALPTDEPTPKPVTPSVIQHAVQPGQTLLGIAVDYGVSMAAIQLANGMGNSIDLIAGQSLSIPGSTQWLGESYFWVVHVVQAGETLVGLASAYDLSVDDILRVNAIADPALIHVEQRLVMPVEQLVTLKAPQPTATAVPVAGAAADAQEAPTPESDTAPETDSPVTEAPAPETPPTAVPPPGPPSGPADWPAYILARINQVRAEHGLNTLTIVPELSHAAQAHAEDCARRGWGSHVGSDGAVLKTRLERAGYLGDNSGENWVQAPNSERAFEWWYGEIPPNDPHRRNILSPRYTEIGIGIAETGRGYIFVTDFGHR